MNQKKIWDEIVRMAITDHSIMSKFIFPHNCFDKIQKKHNIKISEEIRRKLLIRAIRKKRGLKNRRHYFEMGVIQIPRKLKKRQTLYNAIGGK